MRQAGFGIVFDLKVKKNVSRVLMCKLMGNIDPDTMRLDCGSNKVLEINREAVHHIFDFPMGSHTAPRPADSGHDDSLANLKDELGFNRSRSIDVKDLLILLRTLAADPAKVNKTVKVFFLIVFQSLLCPSPATRLSRVAAMVENLDFASMASMDFCQLVVDELQAAVYKWNSEGSKQNCAEGCTIVPLFMYLDSLNLRTVSVMHTRTPRAAILSHEQLKKIHNADIIVKGKIHLDTYKFGKLPVSA